MIMPDPDKVDLSQSIQNYYEGPQGLAVSLREHYLSTGEDSPEEPPELEPPELHIKSGDKQFSGIENYEVKKENLRMAGVDLVESYGDVPDRIRRSAGYSKDVRVWTSKFIEGHNAAISQWPPDGVSHDEYCVNEIIKTIDNLDAIMADAVKGQKKEAGEIDKLTQLVEKLRQEVKGLKQQVGDKGEPRPGNPDPEDLGVPKEPGLPFEPGIPYDPSLPMDPRLPMNQGLPLDSGQSLDPGLPEDPGASLYPSDVDLDPQEAVAVPAASATTPGGSAMGSGSDQQTGIPNWMIPAMLADSTQPGVRNEPDPDRLPRDDEAVVPAPIPAVTAAPGTTPWSQPPTGAVPNQSQSVGPGAGPNVTSAQNGLPTRPPGQDDSVEYTFPDGRTQRVSAVVAQALDAAFGNASGTDAKAAYAKTPAKWSDNKQIDPVGPYQLMTGDVATWDKDRTAIVVVFGSFEGGPPEVVVNGQLGLFAAEMSDSAGDFGAFAGFRHPRGIEITAPASDSAAPASSPADASAATATSVAAAPAT
ncbi:hypothetical protein AB4305_28935 [Nocardia sp. 2YAB30]|uniref:hypothetical protein n=1 Tax=Nocardia sp. 2YAB30 TaxID=3233022 RepID=UPI003F9E73BC